MVLTGLRGVGKTVLLNAMRSAAVRRGLGHRQGRGPAGPVDAAPAGGRAAPGRARARPAPDPAERRPRARRTQGVRPARADPARRPGARRGCATAGSRASTCRPSPAGPTPATSRSTWSSCSPTSAGWPATSAAASRCSSTRCRISARRTCRRCARPATRCPSAALPLVVVGAGLPHLPAVLSAAKSYSERLFRFAAHRPARPGRRRPRAARARPATRAPTSTTTRSTPCTQRPAATPTSCRPTARSPGTPRRAVADHRRGRRGRRAGGRARARRRILRLPLRAGHPGRAGVSAGDGRPRPTPRAATDAGRHRGGGRRLGRPPQSLSPARDGLLKKGLVYSAQRGQIAYTVPHFGRYLRAQDD